MLYKNIKFILFLMLELIKKIFAMTHNVILHRQVINHKTELICASLRIKWQTIFFLDKQIFLLQATKTPVQLTC